MCSHGERQGQAGNGHRCARRAGTLPGKAKLKKTGVAQLNGTPTTEETKGRTGSGGAPLWSPRSGGRGRRTAWSARTPEQSGIRGETLSQKNKKERKEGRTSADRDVGKGNPSLYSVVET